MSLSIKSTGSFAFMGIAAAVTREAALRVAMADELQSLYAALYAGRFASTPCGKAMRQDHLDTSTVHVYTNPRAYRKAARVALVNTH